MSAILQNKRTSGIPMYSNHIIKLTSVISRQEPLHESLQDCIHVYSVTSSLASEKIGVDKEGCDIGFKILCYHAQGEHNVNIFFCSANPA